MLPGLQGTAMRSFIRFRNGAVSATPGNETGDAEAVGAARVAVSEFTAQADSVSMTSTHAAHREFPSVPRSPLGAAMVSITCSMLGSDKEVPADPGPCHHGSRRGDHF